MYSQEHQDCHLRLDHPDHLCHPTQREKELNDSTQCCSGGRTTSGPSCKILRSPHPLSWVSSCSRSACLARSTWTAGLSRCTRWTGWSWLPGCSRLAGLTKGTLWPGVSRRTRLTWLTTLARLSLDAADNDRLVCFTANLMVRTLGAMYVQ